MKKLLLVALLTTSPAMASKDAVYRVCWVKDRTKASVEVVTKKHMEDAYFCVWDTLDCETATMVVHEADKSGPDVFPVFKSHHWTACR